MRREFSAVFFAFVVAAAALVAGCGGSGNSRGGGLNIVVTIKASGSTTVLTNQPVQFTDTVTGTPNTAVTWEVNATAGGDINTIGSIDANGKYTAPPAPPAGGGTVSITAVSQADNKTTSNAITVTVMNNGAAAIVPANPSVLAGSTQAFTVQQNGQMVAATWGISSAAGGDIGSIDANSGVYTAPLNIPAGQVVTVTATTASGMLQTSAMIVFSAASFNGQYAFAFAGEDSKGKPVDVAGSLVASGPPSSTMGSITGGVMDVNSVKGVLTACPLTAAGGFMIGADGRSSAMITCTPVAGQPITFTLHFVLISNQHALLADFDASDTGSGTIDLQNTGEFLLSNITGNYVFAVAGTGVSNGNVFPLTAGGTFAADGAGGITSGSGIEDAVFPATSPALTKGDQTLGGSYRLDAANANFGRGTLTMTTVPAVSHNPLASAQFAFYLVDQTHLKLVEIDEAQTFVLSGDMFSAPTGPFNDTNLSGNYVVSVSGKSANGPYALTGVWTYNGALDGQIIAGEEDFNDAGSATASAQSLLETTYIVSPPSPKNAQDGVFDRFLINIKDSKKGRQYEYAVYLASSTAALMVEIDFDPPPPGGTGFGTGIVASGISFPQQAAPSTIPAGGGFAVVLAGSTIPAGSDSDQDTVGAVLLTSPASVAGNLDIDKPAGSAQPTSAMLTGASVFVLPDNLGRGTATLTTGTMGATAFNLVYYLIDDNIAVLLDTNGSRSASGSIARQF